MEIKYTKSNVIDGNFFDGKENKWETSEKVTDRWEKSDSNLADWLKKSTKLTLLTFY